MKLDFDLMRVVLAHVEAETIRDFLDDAASMTKWKEGQLLSDYLSDRTRPEVRVVLRHVQLLVDAGYIEGITVTESLDGFYSFSTAPHPGLTLSGYSLLESLRTKGFVEKLRDFAKSKSVPLTIETLKIIVSAALPKLLS